MPHDSEEWLPVISAEHPAENAAEPPTTAMTIGTEEHAVPAPSSSTLILEDEARAVEGRARARGGRPPADEPPAAPRRSSPTPKRSGSTGQRRALEPATQLLDTTPAPAPATHETADSLSAVTRETTVGAREPSREMWAALWVALGVLGLAVLAFALLSLLS